MIVFYVINRKQQTLPHVYYISQLCNSFPFPIPTWVGIAMTPKVACGDYIGHQGPFKVVRTCAMLY